MLSGSVPPGKVQNQYHEADLQCPSILRHRHSPALLHIISSLPPQSVHAGCEKDLCCIFLIMQMLRLLLYVPFFCPRFCCIIYHICPSVPESHIFCRSSLYSDTARCTPYSTKWILLSSKRSCCFLLSAGYPRAKREKTSTFSGSFRIS